MKLATTTSLTSFLIILIASAIANAQQDSTFFFEAKTLMFQQKYDEALNSYELLKAKFPDSKYADDAEFWSAYILEQQGKNTFAFNAYRDLAQKYPSSPWTDDALVRQIGLAEKFVKDGQENYLDFLNEALASPYTNVRYQAALSLGKFRDERAVPALKEMSKNGDRDMRSIARSLLNDYPSQAIDKQPRQTPIPMNQQRSKIEPKKDAIQTPRTQPQKEIKREQRQRTPAPPKINRSQPPKQTTPKSTPPKTSAPPKKSNIS